MQKIWTHIYLLDKNFICDPPKASVRTNNAFSDYFKLDRGTRQGCPLQFKVARNLFKYVGIQVTRKYSIYLVLYNLNILTFWLLSHKKILIFVINFFEV